MQKFSKDKHFSELLKGSSITFMFKITGMGLGYLLTLLVARWYGADTLGLYALSLTILNIFVTFGVFGFDNTLIKFVADYNSNGKEYLSKEVYIKALSIVIPIGLFLSFLLYVGSNYLSTTIFKKEHLTIFLQITALGILPFILLRINATLFRALKKIKIYAFFDTLGIFLFSSIMLLTATFFFKIPNSTIVISVQILSIILLMAVSFLYVTKYTSLFKIAPKNILKYKNILKVSFPMLLTSSMALVMGWTDIIMLGIFRSETEVGIYSIVVKLASLTSITLMAINSIAAPKFSEFYSKGDMQALKKTAQDSTKMIFFSSLPIILILSIFPKYILSIFGDQFVIGVITLWLLMAGQIINAITGSVGYILIMTGKEKVFQNIIFFTSILNIILNYIFVQKYGMNGIAFSTALSISLLNIIPYFLVRHYYGFFSLTFRGTTK